MVESINESNLVEFLMSYEEGGLNEAQTVELFRYLISTNKINSLQGHYQRMARTLHEKGAL